MTETPDPASAAADPALCRICRVAPAVEVRHFPPADPPIWRPCAGCERSGAACAASGCHAYACEGVCVRCGAAQPADDHRRARSIGEADRRLRCLTDDVAAEAREALAALATAQARVDALIARLPIPPGRVGAESDEDRAWRTRHGELMVSDDDRRGVFAKVEGDTLTLAGGREGDDCEAVLRVGQAITPELLLQVQDVLRSGKDPFVDYEDEIGRYGHTLSRTCKGCAPRLALRAMLASQEKR